MASINKRILPSGKPQWRVSYFDLQGNRKRPGFSSWTLADKFRQEIEEQIRKGTYRPDADKITMAEVCQSYLDYAEGRMLRNERMTRKLLTVYRGHVSNHILHPGHGIARYKLSQLTSRAVGDLRDRIRSAGVSVPTARKILATLHTILEYAISQDWVAVNAASGVKVIGPRGEGSKKIVPPSKIDMKNLLDVAADDLRFMVLFAASTGLRAGEQWALRWSDVDIEVGELTVERRVDSYGEEGAPKSVAGVRSVPLSAMLIRYLKEWKLRLKFKSNDDLVFQNRVGRFMCHDNMVKRRYKPTLEAAGVSGINWHSLRHYAISTWIEAGLAPKTVQTFAGHSSLAVTMDRYGHLFPSDNHKAAMDVIAGELMG
ncbi:site-specific integrase [Rhodospirillales bacterium]|nr:site-specific integrase [Rhodospirillales bacterium]